MGVLKAKVGGAWVPILQGQSFASGTYVGAAQLVNDLAVPTASGVVDITGCSVTWTADPTHTYRTWLQIGAADQTVANGRQTAYITDGANTLKRTHAMDLTTTSPSRGSFTLWADETGLSGSQTRKARFQVNAGTATLIATAAPTYAPRILVEDITPASQTLVVETATFTPTWTGWTIGSGGGDYCRYTFVGPTGVGAVGMLTLDVVSQLGTSGYSVAGNPTLTLPTGFNLYPGPAGVSREPAGRAIYRDADLAKHYFGVVEWSTASTVRFYAEDVSGTYMVEATITSTVPFTWANGDMIRVLIGPFPAVRV